MARQGKTIGTGITKREIVVCDGEDMQTAWVESFSQWEAKRKKGGGDYGAASLHIIERCHRILADSGTGPHETDSAADFAQRIIRSHTIAQAAIKRDDADAAARFALDVGALAAQAKIKLVIWNTSSLHYKRALESLMESAYGKCRQERSTDRAVGTERTGTIIFGEAGSSSPRCPLAV